MASPNELSFLPDDYLERKAQRRTNAICAVLFLVVIVAIGSAFSYTDRSVRDLEKEHESVEKEYTEAAKRIDLVKELQDKQRQMATQAELAASLLEKVPRSFVLAEVTNALPTGVSLLDLTLESHLHALPPLPPKSAFDAKRADSTGAPPVEQPKQYDVSLRISGIAYTDVQVAQFITRLNQSKLLSDVNLVISDEFKQDDQSLRRFQVEAMIDPNADVTAPQKSSTAAVELKETN
jgi:Tfp pilus assembly protein PilN